MTEVSGIPAMAGHRGSDGLHKKCRNESNTAVRRLSEREEKTDDFGWEQMP